MKVGDGLRIVMEQGEATSTDIAKELDIGNAHAYKLLKGLYKKGLLDREKEINEFNQTRYRFTPTEKAEKIIEKWGSYEKWRIKQSMANALNYGQDEAVIKPEDL